MLSKSQQVWLCSFCHVLFWQLKEEPFQAEVCSHLQYRGDRQTDNRQKTDITTFKLNRPLVRFSENIIEKNQMDSIVLFSGDDREEDQ